MTPRPGTVLPGDRVGPRETLDRGDEGRDGENPDPSHRRRVPVGRQHRVVGNDQGSNLREVLGSVHTEDKGGFWNSLLFIYTFYFMFRSIPLSNYPYTETYPTSPCQRDFPCKLTSVLLLLSNRYRHRSFVVGFVLSVTFP